MRKHLLSSLASFSALWFALPSCAQKNFEEGLTPAELQSVARALPVSPIMNLRIFREGQNDRLSAAVLTAVTHVGWRVVVLSPSLKTAYKVSWQSEPLKDSFAVSSPHQLSTYGIRDEEAVTFSGCAAHQCPDIFSVLLYVPSLHKAFTAMCRDKATTYSLRTPSEVATYKDDLNDLLRGMPGHEQACSSEIKPEKREVN